MKKNLILSSLGLTALAFSLSSNAAELYKGQSEHFSVGHRDTLSVSVRQHAFGVRVQVTEPATITHCIARLEGGQIERIYPRGNQGPILLGENQSLSVNFFNANRINIRQYVDTIECEGQSQNFNKARFRAFIHVDQVVAPRPVPPVVVRPAPRPVPPVVVRPAPRPRPRPRPSRPVDTVAQVSACIGETITLFSTRANVNNWTINGRYFVGDRDFRILGQNSTIFVDNTDRRNVDRYDVMASCNSRGTDFTSIRFETGFGHNRQISHQSYDITCRPCGRGHGGHHNRPGPGRRGGRR